MSKMLIHKRGRGNTVWYLVLEDVFRFKEAGLKLDVTTWIPRFMQSVYEEVFILLGTLEYVS